MSWDIFVQDLPKGVRRVQEIPEDFVPQPLGTRGELVRRIHEIAPEVDFDDRGWGQLDGDGYAIEISLGENEVVESVALHVRGDKRAVYMVQHVLHELQLRALDPSSDSGIFSLEAGSLDGFTRWRAFRDTVIRSEGA